MYRPWLVRRHPPLSLAPTLATPSLDKTPQLNTYATKPQHGRALLYDTLSDCISMEIRIAFKVWWIDSLMRFELMTKILRYAYGYYY